MKDIKFDDIDALQAEVTEEFGAWSETTEVTQEMINQFADLTGDHQWIHVDVERSKKESPFGGPVAHGFLTLSLLPSMRIKERAFKITGFGNAANYGSSGSRFIAPVPAGSTIHARSRLAEIEARPKGTLVTMETAVHVVGNDKPSLLYKMLIMYMPPWN